MIELNTLIEEVLDSIYEILNEIKKIPEINIFSEPISDEIAPSYKNIIKNPMDMSTLESNLKNKHYNFLIDFLLDLQLIWNNCRAFNKNNTSFYRNADKFDKKVIFLLIKYFGRVFKEKYEDYLIKNDIYFKDQNNRISEKLLKNYTLLNTNNIQNQEQDSKLFKKKLSILQGIKKLKKNEINIFLKEIICNIPKNYYKMISSNELSIRLDNDKSKIDKFDKLIQDLSKD